MSRTSLISRQLCPALASAAALAVLETLDAEGLIAGAARKGAYLQGKLRDLVARYPARFESERGLGLLRGLVMRPGVDGREALARVRERGVLLTVAGERTLRFTPPLVVTEAELDEALDLLGMATPHGR